MADSPVYVNINIDPRTGSQANSNGPITDPDVLDAVMVVHNYLSSQAGRPSATTGGSQADG